MITFKEYLRTIDLSEAIEGLHPDLQKHLDNPKQFLKTKSALEKSGEDTGMTTEKHGSGSRFYIPQKNKTKIKLDGKDTEIHAGIKFHNPGFSLNAHHPNGRGESFGRDQNVHESDVSHHYGTMKKDENGHFQHNEHGCVATVLSHGDDYDHIVQEKLDKFNAKRFEKETKSESHPKGMKFKHFQAALQREWAHAQGRNHYSSVSDEDMDKAMDNPHTQRFHDMCMSTGTSPNDFDPRNMGHSTNPHTGESRPALLDGGASDHILSNYGKARKSKWRV